MATITGTSASETLKGTSANDQISGLDGDDVLKGGGGNDGLDGGSGDDKLYGGAGMDGLVGEGHDTLIGGAGDDTYTVHDANVIILEGAKGGFDTINLDFSTDLTTIDRYGHVERVVLMGNADLDVIGNQANQTFTGNSGKNVIHGGGGDDFLFAGSNKDYVYGDAGNDTISGSTGNDVMYGGADADTFSFGNQPITIMGTISDFSSADGDVIDLSSIDAVMHVKGNQAFHFVDAFTHTAGEAMLTYDALSNQTTLLLDMDGDAEANRYLVFDGHVTADAGWIL